jgi:hypothetical protein
MDPAWYRRESKEASLEMQIVQKGDIEQIKG